MYKFDAMPGGFSLRHIDPASIESHGNLSYGFIDHPESFDNYRDPRKADSTLVLFKTRDGKQEIKSAVLPVTLKGGEEISFDQPVSSGRFIFHQQERAERFVTAFKHAVVLCGGKTSDFVRTPQD